ncbi:MAG: HAD hydrolase-like protein, partial [Woeseiaceae bacterium]
MTKRDLVFDLDGTLSNPALGIVRSMNHALAAFDYEQISEDCVSAYIGPPIDDAFRKLAPSAEESVIVQLVSKFRE